MAAKNFKITTPHAAVIVWNYDDKGGLQPFTSSSVNNVQQTIISTLSCVSISTQKSKSNPQGGFTLVLAPYKDWISTITPGSWCTLLMSQEPITADDILKADKNKVKMIGKIDSVRVDTSMGEDGARRTTYVVTGVDWGYIFNNIIYIDNFIGAANEPNTLGTGTSIAIQNILFGNDGIPKSNGTPSNLRSLINIFGKTLGGITSQGADINVLANAIYNFLIPQEMIDYFDFIGPDGQPTSSQKINDILTLVTGSLSADDTYNGAVESIGFIDPYSLQGQHTFWQVLQENSNPVLNEMITDLRWNDDSSLTLALYNRIKPFSFSSFDPDSEQANGLKSFFQYLKTVEIDDIDVISINAGTNWNDKYNFVEIKPQFQSFAVFANWYKQKSQKFDSTAFSREGFRPLILDTKQFPGRPGQTQLTSDAVNWDALTSWTGLLAEWYFNTHRMLNGSMTIIGQNNYIGVGDNIRINADLISPTPNLKAQSLVDGTNSYMLAHVESVANSFTVSPDGSRQFITTIQFVRGILVYENGQPVDGGALDRDASSIQDFEEKNTQNVISTSDNSDPDPIKVRGT